MTKKKKQLMERLDVLWSKAVRITANNKCKVPGCYETCVDPHHIIRRSHKATRWILSNGICLCRKHHRFIHDNPTQGKKLIIGLIGERYYEALEKLSLTTPCFEEHDLERMIDETKKTINIINN